MVDINQGVRSTNAVLVLEGWGGGKKQRKTERELEKWMDFKWLNVSVSNQSKEL